MHQKLYVTSLNSTKGGSQNLKGAVAFKDAKHHLNLKCFDPFETLTTWINISKRAVLYLVAPR